MSVARGDAPAGSMWNIREDRNNRGRWLLPVALVALAVYPAWLRGGTYVPVQGPLIWLGLAVMAAYLFVPHTQNDRIGLRILRLLRDPLFYLGAAFLFLLAAQYWNAGRELVFDPSAYAWVYSLPRFPSLPSAVTRPEAAEMLRWFFPVWCGVICLRAGIRSGRTMRMVYRAIALNAGFLSLFGVIQYVSGTGSIYWIQPLDCHFFASFGYGNHAGAYFTLMFGLSAGLLVNELARSVGAWRKRRIALLLVCTIAVWIGAHLALSRAAIIFTWFISVAVTGYGFVKIWKYLRPGQRVNAVVMVIAIALLCAVVLTAVAREAIREEFSTMQAGDPEANIASGEWGFLRSAAFNVWKDYPWFGVGGWGFRYMLGVYLPSSEWKDIRTGAANVHNDPLQFLVEFGAVGAGLLGIILFVLVWAVIRKANWRQPVVAVTSLALAVTFAHSLIDLPFRSPAILYVWLILLSGLPVVGGSVGSRLDTAVREDMIR